MSKNTLAVLGSGDLGRGSRSATKISGPTGQEWQDFDLTVV